MRRRPWTAGLTLAMGILACSFTTDPTSTPAPASATPAPSTHTPTAVQTYVLPSVTPSPTSTLAFAAPKDQRLNCRFGPATVYAVTGALEVGKLTQIAGRNADDTWWYVHDPGNPGGFCWVLAALTETSGNTSGLPVVRAPDVSVTKIAMSVEPPHRSVTCNAFPQTFYVTAEVTANGPAVVIWRWEVSTGEVSPENMLSFTEAGSQVLENYYQTPGANDYFISLHVLSPNDVNGRINFRVDCTQ
jgi:SH3-like domain-containing protein